MGEWPENVQAHPQVTTNYITSSHAVMELN